MADISDTGLDKMAKFCEFQRKANPDGIGNECTHIVYAALFEVNAMDGSSDVNRRGSSANPMVQTSRIPYHWGRGVGADGTRSGDIVQFEGVVQTRHIYSEGQPWRNDIKKRAPHHTGIMQTGALWGGFNLYEAHITQDSYGLMQVRINSIFYETYAVMLTKNDLQGSSNLMQYVKKYANDTAQLLDMVNWGALRSSFSVTPLSAAQIRTAFNSGSSPKPDAGIFFQVNVTGSIRFYRPQVSVRRQNMTTDAQRNAEKTKLIRSMQRSGRAGPVGFNWNWQFRDQ